MRTAAFLAAAAVASLASASKLPNKVEARATSSTTAATTLPTITPSGNAFYVGDDRFYIRGVDYQPGGSSEAEDPLAKASICKRDIPYFQKLGLNAIRVYTVDNSVNHDECMNALAEAGIYLILDVNTPYYSLNRDAPAESYNPTYLQSIFATIDQFAGYTNTLAFLSGNEVINTADNTNTAPYIKAVTRDMKLYIGERGYRAIPVGYSAADVSQNQYLMAQYMDCGDAWTRSDFYAINNYEWCDPSTFDESGWDILVEQYLNYSQPVFLSEYGCVMTGSTRTFEETSALYKEEMTKAISGGLVYEYSQSTAGYGLVTIDGDTVTPVGEQFTYLEERLANTSDPSGDGGAHGNTARQPCPALSDDWQISPFSENELPAMPKGALKYLVNGAGKGPGLSDDSGSQDAAGGSSSTASVDFGEVTTTYGDGVASATGSTTSSSSSSSSSSAASPALAPAEYKPFFICSLVIALGFGFGAVAL